METILIVVACLAIAVYVVWCRRRDCRADREHQAIMTAMSPGPRIRELTIVRSNPMRTRRFASGSQPVFPATKAEFAHVPTDYHHRATCVEAPAHDIGHAVSHSDGCSTIDTSHGEFDGGGHHGH